MKLARLHNCRGDLVRPVFANVLDLGVNGFDALLFAGPLRHGQLVFVGAGEIRAAVEDAIGASDLVFQAQVDADPVQPQGQLGFVCNLTLKVDIPTPPGVLSETSCLDAAFHGARQTTRRKRRPP